MELGGSIDHLITTLQTKTRPESKRVSRAFELDAASAENTNASIVALTPTSISPEGTSLLAYQSPKPSLVDDEGVSQQPPPPLITRLSTSTSPDCTSAAKLGPIAAFIRNGISQIISARTANAIVDRYCIELSANFPAVAFDPATSATEVCSTKLVLFLAILAAGSGGVCDIDTQKRLRRLLTRVLTHCLHNQTEYTLELVQAFILSALWHAPSEPIQGEESMDIEQLSHSAAHIGTHIGLGKRSMTANRDFPARRYEQHLQNVKSFQIDDLEARRTWLGCYYICANVSMPSQQPSLLCWNQYMDECIEALETSPLALPSDKQFCKHVRIQHATDEHSRNVLASHFFRPGSISRPDTDKILGSFQRQLTTVDESTLSNAGNGIERLLYHSSTLYLHEVVAAIHHNADGIGSGVEDTQGATSRQLCAELLTSSSPGCRESAHTVISIFTSLDLRDIRAMPTIFLIRVIHAITVLVTCGVSTDSDCDSGSTSPGSEYSRVEHQLDDMIDLMATWGSDWPACKLIRILIKLRRRLRQNQDKSTATSGSSSQGSCNLEEDRETRSPMAVVDLSTPLPYHGMAQQPLQFGLEDFILPESMSYSDPGFWDDFIEMAPQDKMPMPMPMPFDSSTADLWASQPSAQQAMLSNEDWQGENVVAMELFANSDENCC
ncbi:MAG: hypothetical protein M1818_002862 [Claussenomyces sp. TS43310]|nr:MAG: hypothetical protein M1818_002862 [Claussenomyces sp. TS43310]